MELRPIAASNAPAAPVLAGKLPLPNAAPPGSASASGVAASAPVATAAAPQRAEPEPSQEQVSEALKSINSVLQVRSQDLEFSVDSESARTIVTVTDKNTKEVIRQMPTREAMEIAKALDRLQSLLIRQTA